MLEGTHLNALSLARGVAHGARLAAIVALAAAGAVLATAAQSGAEGEDASPDKGGYHAMRPTPRGLMRELSTDRPDVTESPYTVDAGHLQVELDLVNFSRDERFGSRTERFGFATANVKMGLANQVDVQLIMEPYRLERTLHAGVELPSAGSSASPAGEFQDSGMGDLTVRLKVNACGNDGGGIAVALMPFVVVPTSSNAGGRDPWGVGLSVPLGIGLPGGFDSGFMAQASVQGPASELLGTATLGHALHGPLAGFLEITGARPDPADSREWVSTFDAGLTWAVSPDLRLDGGVLIGLTEAAEDVTGFLGLAIRR